MSTVIEKKSRSYDNVNAHVISCLFIKIGGIIFRIADV